jgi:hypothetical protein
MKDCYSKYNKYKLYVDSGLMQHVTNAIRPMLEEKQAGKVILLQGERRKKDDLAKGGK